MKICKKCGIEKQIEHFTFRIEYKTYRNTCKSCRKIQQNNAYKANPLKYKTKQLLRIYNITHDMLIDMIKTQNNKCDICFKEFDVSINYKNCNVDHNHISGKIRGLLCSKCNMAIGLFQESEENLINAIKYLNKHRS